MKARIIHTKFYESERVLQLSQQSRWLFMYYLTCGGLGMTGAFKGSDSKTIFETGFDSKGLAKAKNELQASKLVVFHKGWIVIPDADEKTKYSEGKKTKVAYDREFNSLPTDIKEILTDKDILDTLSEEGDRVSEVAPTDDTTINHKTEIRKEGGVGETKELTDEFCEKTSQEMRLPPGVVKRKALQVLDYEKSSGKKYKDRQAALRQWLRRDIETGKLIPSKAETVVNSSSEPGFVPVSSERLAFLKESAKARIGL